jgi:hypothetical protein
MSEQGGIKEPSFFCTDLYFSHQIHIPPTWNDYLRLFENAPASAQFLGEATPRYLRSKVAVSQILEQCPDSRFIVMLRNPVDLAASQHNQRVKEGFENLGFETAWERQATRLTGQSSLPARVAEGEYLHYAEIAMLGKQLQNLTVQVERAQVHWIFFEDFKKDTRRCYQQVLEFLEVKDDGRTDFGSVNVSLSYRSLGFNNVLRIAGRFRKRLGLPGLGVQKRLNGLNAKPGREPLRPEFKRELQNYFKEDIKLLTELTGRDLRHWYADA